jgi:hypothetical protein
MISEKIKEYYLKVASEQSTLNSFERVIVEFLSQKTIDPSLVNKALSSEENAGLNDLEKDLEINRKFLALNCLLEISDENEELKKNIQSAFKEMKPSPFEKDFQLLNSLIALNSQYLLEKKKDVQPKLHPSGACPMEWKGYFPWATLPQAQLQAEAGACWAILGKLRNDANLLSAAASSAEWIATHYLDHKSIPAYGLFRKESQASNLDVLSANILLFHTVATICGNASLETLAREQVVALRESSEEGNLSYLAFVTIVLEWIGNVFSVPTPQAISLETYFCDPHVGLVGARTADAYVACTLLGSNTGLGTYSKGDVSVLNFGPQLFPLGDCKNFGIERTFRPESQSNPGAFFESSSKGFLLKGNCKVATHGTPTEDLSDSQFTSPEHSGIWMDVCQKYEEGVLTLEISPYGLLSNENLAFAFYVKGKSCNINGLTVSPRSLDRYEGKVESILIQGEDSEMKIEMPLAAKSLQVIPLAGDNHFWASDFLVAYSIPVGSETYSWKLSTTAENA